jgi:hypothetical protein
VSPDGEVVCSIKRIAAGMIEVIVGIECSFYRHWADGAESIHLKLRSRGANIALNQKCAVFSGQKTAVAHGLEVFGGIRNGGVEAVADFSDRRESLSATTVWDKRELFCRRAAKAGKGIRLATECSAAKEAGYKSSGINAENIQSSHSPMLELNQTGAKFCATSTSSNCVTGTCRCRSRWRKLYFP